MRRKPAFHEDYGPRAPVETSSERGFGLVFAAVFVIVALWPLTGEGGTVSLWSLGVAGAFVAAALAVPRVLRPLNRVWMRFGLVLHRVVNPLVMGLIFFLSVVPVGLLMRALGKRPLALGFEPDAPSYWIVRDPAGPAPETMSRQF